MVLFSFFKKFQIQGIDVNLQRQRTIGNLEFFIHFLIFFGLLAIDIQFDAEDEYLYGIDAFRSLTKLFGYGFTQYLMLMYAFSLCAIYMRMLYLNRILVKLFSFSVRIHSTILILPQDMPWKIREVSHTYAVIVDTLDLVNQFSSVRIMVCFAFAFIYTIFTIFGTFRLIMEWNSADLHIFGQALAWNFTFLVVGFFILFFSGRIQSEVR